MNILPSTNKSGRNKSPISEFGLNDFAILIAMANGRNTPFPFNLTLEVLEQYFKEEPTLPEEAKGMNMEIISEYISKIENISNCSYGEDNFKIFKTEEHIGMPMVCSDMIERNKDRYKSEHISPYVFLDFGAYCNRVSQEEIKKSVAKHSSKDPTPYVPRIIDDDDIPF